jgi:type IV pilus assembly protein PilB
VSPREILSAAAQFYGLEYIDLSNFELSASMFGQVRESMVREYLFLPLNEESGVLKIVVTHPSDAGVVRSALNQEVVPVLALREQLIEAINRSYENAEQGAADVWGRRAWSVKGKAEPNQRENEENSDALR